MPFGSPLVMGPMPLGRVKRTTSKFPYISLYVLMKRKCSKEYATAHKAEVQMPFTDSEPVCRSSGARKICMM